MRIRLTRRHILLLKGIIHALGFGLLAWNFYLALQDQLGADPVKAIIHFTGISAFNFLLITLAVTPLAKKLKASTLVQTRRLLGLYAFVYGLLHLLSYIAFELQFDWQYVIPEILERPYITVGFVALVLMTMLAVTSFNRLKRRMGKHWQRLHNTVYLAAGLIALHYTWSVKSDLTQPIIYWVILILLLSDRRQKLQHYLKRRKQKQRQAPMAKA